MSTSLGGDTVAAVPVRPLGLVELLDGAVRLVRANIRAALALGLPFAFVRTLVITAVVFPFAATSATSALQSLALLGAAGLFGTMRTGVLTPLFVADLMGRRITGGGALRRAAASLLALLGLGVVMLVVQSAGTLALGVAGVWLWGVWSVAAPAAVTERLGPLRALRRSFALVRTAFWRTWSIRALGAIVSYVLGGLFTLPFTVLAAVITGNNPLTQSADGSVTDPTLFTLVAAIGALLGAAVTGPFSSAIDVLLYTDRRTRREGMDFTLTLPAAADPGAALGTTPAARPLTVW